MAFRHSEAHDELWMRCTARARGGDMFCPRHREAANEIALGLASREVSETDLRGMMSEAARMLAALRPAPATAGYTNKGNQR